MKCKLFHLASLFWCWAGLTTVAQENAQPPYPPSTYISDVYFSPDSTIIRMAHGGDNWPISWAKDGHLYTTYGDGFGFVPKIEEKLGLGFARIEGSPPNIKGINLRSRFENKGYGRNGKKGTGLLAIDNRVYIWLMHANERGGEAQLAWTDNHFAEIKWSDWKFREFGICSFINYGRNNQGARDRFVYIVSHDGPRADTPADHFVLMRVPGDQISDRHAYEFYAGLEETGEARWTSYIDKRTSVFSNPRQCLRSSISYNPGLERYLWWQQIPNFNHPQKDFGDTRFEGGFGLYEAPEPWGPWRTVYYTERWDVGPGELACFPIKWMSPDGTNCYMVFSGEDAFSVRGVQFMVQE